MAKYGKFNSLIKISHTSQHAKIKMAKNFKLTFTL